MITPALYTVQYLFKEQLTNDTFSFYFRRPKTYSFFAGQYNRLTLPITATDGRGASRFFSVSSSPLITETISITTKIQPSDFKNALASLRENDEVKLFGPMGQFILNETDTRQKICISGGIGIAPINSMVRYIIEKKMAIPITLLASFSLAEEVIFLDELQLFAKDLANIQLHYTVTKPAESQKEWKGSTGRITENMIAGLTKNIFQTVFYIVGSVRLVDGVVEMLENMKLTNENIKVEIFTGY